MFLFCQVNLVHLDPQVHWGQRGDEVEKVRTFICLRNLRTHLLSHSAKSCMKTTKFAEQKLLVHFKQSFIVPAVIAQHEHPTHCLQETCI